MDKYRLVDEKFIGAEGFIDDDDEREAGDGEGEARARGVVRIVPTSRPRGCITVAMDLLASGPRRVELRAVGKAINKAVTIAEILKHKMPLHQVTALSSCEVVGVYAPLEEGLDDVVNRHYVSCVSITLSADLGPGIDVKDKGYQPPITDSEMQPGDFAARTRSADATT